MGFELFRKYKIIGFRHEVSKNVRTFSRQIATGSMHPNNNFKNGVGFFSLTEGLLTKGGGGLRAPWEKDVDSSYYVAI